ncbi:DNA polymerase subunit Cdc27 [Cunninghamella echinulata]|nr:DNA polymerase subunit Cdc27 [Cunninghamella echinulata]
MLDFKSFLDTTVLQEKKPVTFKLLARTLNIHVNLAKQALYQYATSEPSVTTIYCITGILEDNVTSIQLIESNKLEETKKRYLKVSSVHVYSIIPYQPKDLSVLVLANKDIMNVSREDRIKNGLIQNRAIEIKKVNQSTTTSSTNTTKSTVNIQSSNHANQIKTTTSSTSTKSKVTTPAKRKGTLSFDKAPKPKKSATETTKSVVETSNSEQPEFKNKTIKSIQISDDEEDEEDEESLDARLARSATIHVNDIFSDDEEMDDESKSTKATDNSANGENKTTTAAAPDMDIDIDNHDDDKNEPEPSALSDENENHEVTPGKIRRKVQKKKTYKNERGFLVTETVWEWEEVDDDTVHKSAEASTKKTPTLQQSKTAKKPTNSKKTEQKSLLSFWGKQ